MFITRSFNNIIDRLVKNNHHLSRKVLQIHPITLQIIKIWNSATEIEKILKFSRSFIRTICTIKDNQAYGYYWRYLDEFINPQYIRCDNNLNCDIFNLLPGGYLNNYNIQPCFTPLPGEIWKDVIGYKGLYQVSNFGRVIVIRDYPHIKEIVSHIGKRGYYTTMLSKNNTQNRYITHRLISQAFIPNPNNLPCINHKDENKLNNIVDNLEWCTYKYNSNYGTIKERISNSLKNRHNIKDE